MYRILMMKLELRWLKLRITIEIDRSKEIISIKRQRDPESERKATLKRKILRAALEELKMRGPEHLP